MPTRLTFATVGASGVETSTKSHLMLKGDFKQRLYVMTRRILLIVRIAEMKCSLDSSLSSEEKLQAVNDLLQTTLEFHDSIMTVEEYFTHTWDNPNTLKAMDLLAYYLTKEDKDLSTLSRKRMREISRGSERHTTITSMGMERQIRFGMIDND